MVNRLCCISIVNKNIANYVTFLCVFLSLRFFFLKDAAEGVSSKEVIVLYIANCMYVCTVMYVQSNLHYSYIFI